MSKTITLQTAIKQGTTIIPEVDLRKPTTGDLRGLKLSSLLQMDVTTLINLLPRITVPALTPDDVAKLDPADFMALAAEVVSFFLTAQQRVELQMDTPQT